MIIYLWIFSQKEDIANLKVYAEIKFFKNGKKAMVAFIDAQRGHKEGDGHIALISAQPSDRAK